MKIALVSFNPYWEDKAANLTEFNNNIKAAKEANAEYVLFPEMTLTGFSMNTSQLGEDVNASLSIRVVQEISVQQTMNVLFGCILKDKEKYFNSCVAIDSQGQVKGIYNKIHPFSYGDETKYYSKGEELRVLSWEGKWGITICYDLRFPELFQALSRDSLLLVNIANWPAVRHKQWEALLRARAIENQSFIIGVNRTGTDNIGVDYLGGSMVVNPEGRVVEPISVNGEVKIYNICIDDAIEYRSVFPLKSDRRNSFYKKIL